MTQPTPDTLEREKRIPAYVDIARLCFELSICDRTAEAWVRQGILPAPRQRGGKRLWKWTEVERHLDDGATGTPASADSEAERIRDAATRLAEQASENRRGHIRSGDPRLSDLPGLRKTSA